MQTAKEEVSKLLTNLPDECTLEDIQYHLFVIQKLERGMKDASEGKVYSQDEVEQRVAKWLGR